MMFALAAVLRSAVRQDAQQRKVLLFIMPGARPRSMLTIDFMAIQTRRALLDLPSLWDQMTETRIILESTIRSVNAEPTHPCLFGEGMPEFVLLRSRSPETLCQGRGLQLRVECEKRRRKSPLSLLHV